MTFRIDNINDYSVESIKRKWKQALLVDRFVYLHLDRRYWRVAYIARLHVVINGRIRICICMRDRNGIDLHFYGWEEVIV